MTREIKTYLRALSSAILTTAAIVVWVPPYFARFGAFVFFTLVTLWLAYVIAISSYIDDERK